jgi:hypothetical protein
MTVRLVKNFCASLRSLAANRKLQFDEIKPEEGKVYADRLLT